MTYLGPTISDRDRYALWRKRNMRNVVKSTILGIGLLAGVAFSAYAQTDNVAALPPGAQAPTPPAAAVAPSQRLCRPEARRIGRLGRKSRARPCGRRKPMSARSPANRWLGRKSRPRPWASRRTVSAARARTDRRHSVKRTGRSPPAPACSAFRASRRGISRRRDQEHAAEREQRLAVAARRIGSGDPLAVGRLEAAALGLVERREQRRRARSPWSIP